MNEKLYVIFNLNGKVVIKNVEVLKDTEKQLLINCEGVERKQLNKSLIECFVDEYIFGYDKKVLIRLWNSHNEANLAYLKKQTQRVKDLIINEAEINYLLEECC